MNVLEMEELTGSRKKLKPSDSRVNNESKVARALSHRSFMTNILLVAGLAFALLMYVSSSNEAPPAVPAGMHLKTPSPHVGTTAMPPGGSPSFVEGGDDDDDDTGDDNGDNDGDGNNGNNNGNNNGDNNGNNGDDATPSEPDASTPSTPDVPQPSPPTFVVTPTASKIAPNEVDPLQLYSKFATLTPLLNEPLPEEAQAKELADKYGKWGFWDGQEEDRPPGFSVTNYPNRDVPADDFPDDAWQADAVYVNHFISDANKLVSRAMDAIFAEYGRPSDGLSAQELADRNREVFRWDILPTLEFPHDFDKNGPRDIAGWTTKRGRDGLVRRLLHAMITTDTFSVLVAGHSVAAASGNKFQQSYAMQFHKVMAPVFARLGVKLITRNMAQGGLGTLQHSMGFASIYGDSYDLIIWDSGMTEGRDTRDIELFVRQAILSGDRVPVIWGMEFSRKLMELYYPLGVEVGEVGFANRGLPLTKNEQQASEVPWAARYMNCTEEDKPFCEAQFKFCVTCWIDREDVTPGVPQRNQTTNDENWHPGWRHHQLRGRGLAMMMLKALQEALGIWNQGVQGGPPLDDSFWHVTDYYETTRKNVLALNRTESYCYSGFEGLVPTRICHTPMKGATQFTPRHDANNTSLSSITKPAPDGTVIENPVKNLFEGPEPPNPCMQIPEGEIDVYAIVSGRRRLTQRADHEWIESKNVRVPTKARRLNSDDGDGDGENDGDPDGDAGGDADDDGDADSDGGSDGDSEGGIVPSAGWVVRDEPSGFCDGTYNQVCNRGIHNDCLLDDYPSARGHLTGNEDSGWLVFNIPDIKEGIIMVKFLFRGATMSDGSSGGGDGEHDGRALQRYNGMADQPEGMVFEYAIDGKITTLTADEFKEKAVEVIRKVFILTALDDPEFTSETKNVEFALRMRGCGEQCTFGVTHLYWA